MALDETVSLVIFEINEKLMKFFKYIYIRRDVVYIVYFLFV